MEKPNTMFQPRPPSFSRGVDNFSRTGPRPSMTARDESAGYTIRVPSPGR
jgi:hypothetical protein